MSQPFEEASHASPHAAVATDDGHGLGLHLGRQVRPERGLSLPGLLQAMGYERELKPGGGLSSYPHPYLMPDFWQFPTVSMGLGPIMAIYQARFMRYLHDRGLANAGDRKVWAYMGDGEMDEPESLGAISLAAAFVRSTTTVESAPPSAEASTSDMPGIAEISALMFSKSSQCVTSRRKYRHSISIGLSQGL